MALAPGTLFASKYRIVGLLAEGGMGAVYEAEQVKVGRRVALKTMRPELVADEAHRRRFEQEARASARFESDYVVKVYDHDIDRETGIPWIEMEFLRGEHLGALVERRGPLPVAEVRAIFDDLAKGLGPAHAAGVIHLDLKPENLFMVRMQDRAVVKVLDFGIAKIAAEQRKSAAITTLFASPMFLAPEQARKSARVTAATDVWALGLIAFYLLTGRYYWAAANLAPGEVFDQGAQLELLMEISTSTFDPPSARARAHGATVALPAAFDAWFLRCLARDLEARFADATEAVAALRSALAQTVAPPAAQPPIPATRPIATPPTAQPPVPPTQALEKTAVTPPAQLPIKTVPMEGISYPDALAPATREERPPQQSRLALGAGVVALLVVAAGLARLTGARTPVPAPVASVAAPAVAPAVAPVVAPTVAPTVALPETNGFIALPDGSLLVQEHEVTRGEFALWQQRAHPDLAVPAGAAELPMVSVTRALAAEYCAAFPGARLPTRDEWRRALGANPGWTHAVAPAGALAAGGSAARDERSLSDGSLYDLVANVNEWTADGPDTRAYAMGSFFGEPRDTVADYLREGNIEAGPSEHTGLRCVR